jgi:1-phosphofructokinase family hexose kinase
LIVTLTVNPAIDRNVTVDRLVFEDRAYILSQSESAGGRGIQASRVLHSFGASTRALVTSGGPNGARFTEFLKLYGFPVQVYPIRNEIRTNLTITDKQGLTIKLNEFGPSLEPDELAGLERMVAENLEGVDWLMLCGSLPPEVPCRYYSNLIAEARRRGVSVLLDTDGEALVEGIEARPTVVAPNQQEAERLLGTVLITRPQQLDAARRLRQMGAEAVILSLGARGAVAAFGDRLIEVVPPRIEAVSPIGAGDAAAAAFVWAMTQTGDIADAVRWGVAAGTASAMLPGLDFASLDQSKRIYRKVEVRAQ